ncbi:HNH endonuclease [Corallococcus praedator]|uniref:HNH endonuclease n=2 Tax=Myxococcaceae TaxID=31 RepID=A0ABX9QCE9_9BACT|nr:HNH endonuclease [Corallococcus sp. CA031C]RKH96446.1 HNH endonuclease [Corallococcus praedator]
MVLACLALLTTSCVSSPLGPDPDSSWVTQGSGDAVTTDCHGQELPLDWPDPDSRAEVLAPFLTCASPAAFVAMQRGLDMPRLVESMNDWDAVRLGALGPLDAKAARVLNRKRAAFLVSGTERFGVARTEVFALFIIHSAFDDELRAVLDLLARDKQLAETLGAMPTAREQLRQRGVILEEHPERAERTGDVFRGLGRAGRDALSSSEMSSGARYLDLSAKHGQLPSPYRQALDEVERSLMERHFSPASVVSGSFDHLTFGVPLGFFHLVEGTAHGATSLAAGRYEQATRELAPAALMVALYSGSKGARALLQVPRLQKPVLDLTGLKAVLGGLEERLGIDAARDLLKYLRASRENAYVAAEWGEAGVLALYEAQGNAAKAQALLAEANPGRTRPHPTKTAAGRGGIREGSSTNGSATDTPIRNAHLAGQRHPVTGVPFDAEGYPDFKAAGVVKAEVRLEYTGSRAGDFAAANKAAGLRETPKGMTWHHHQDRTTLQLVPTAIHARTGHTGGFSGGP